MNITPADKVVITAQAPAIENPIVCNGWPSVYPARFRAVMRLDGAVNAERARAALIDAILRVQTELSEWLVASDPAGTATFNNAVADDPPLDDLPSRSHHYIGAVYCYAAAKLNDRMAGFDATHQGINRADETLPSTHTLERDGIAHIRAIKGEPAGDVELL